MGIIDSFLPAGLQSDVVLKCQILKAIPLGFLPFLTYTPSLDNLLHTNTFCRQINIPNPDISLDLQTHTFKCLLGIWRPLEVSKVPQMQASEPAWWPKLHWLVPVFCCHCISLQLCVYLWWLLLAWEHLQKEAIFICESLAVTLGLGKGRWMDGWINKWMNSLPSVKDLVIFQSFNKSKECILFGFSPPYCTETVAIKVTATAL